ncbi:flagellar hook-length control protein FliK [Pseudomonadales bacterium]|nr:flagellar hook-length control protein FliK [Pseudomonadales bacterium]
MATVTDINIHAIPVYDGQSSSGLNPAQQGSNRSENFGQALSESSSQYHKNNKEQWVKKEAADSSTVEPAAAAVTETSAAAASNRGEAQQRAINRQAEAASVATESSRVRDERARQDLPVEGNALPKQAVTGRLNAESSGSRQSLQGLNLANTQGSALTTQINQPQSALKLAEQSPTGAAIDPGDLDDGLAALLGRQAGFKDGAQADLLRSPLVKTAQADSTPDGNRAQSVIAAQPVKAAEGSNPRQDASALSAILAMPGLAEQAGKAPLARSALAAAVVTQDRVADLDRRLRLQAAPMGGRSASNGLTTDARPSNTALSWQTPDGFADLLKKSASTTSQVTQISASMPTGQGLNTAQSGGAPVLPTLLDGNAMGGAFKLPSGFEISGGTAQGQMVTPFSQPAWAQELAQQAKFMVRDQLQFVELKLKPANLGSVEIVLKQDDDQTTLMFFAKNPAVREALEASLQKLQKSFDDDGLQLQQTVVSDQSLSEHRQQAASEAEQDQANGLNGAGASGDQSDITDQQAKLLIPANDQLLDLWA